MWNFTGKAVIKPWIDKVRHLFEDTKTASEPQKLLKDIKLEDVQLG
jgi:FMN-dependent NADH-azoreductase